MSEPDRDNSDALPLSSALKIDQLCRSFEEAWHADCKSPQIRGISHPRTQLTPSRGGA